MSESVEAAAAESLVVGGSGIVGGYIVEHLIRAGQHPLALSRIPRCTPGVTWFHGDLRDPGTLKFPPFTTLYCTADAVMLAAALPNLFNPRLRRIVVFSSTSVLTKLDSEIAAERKMWQALGVAEQTIVAACEQHNVEWTILRPTLVYAEGRDANITPLSRLIARYGVMPVVGGGSGLRQPVHGEDLAIGAIAAASSASAANKFYALPGGETLTYREMVGRIFDGLRRPRRIIPVPAFLWRMAFSFIEPLFPGINVAMGLRMTKDLVFDGAPAERDFGWSPRSFAPTFD